mmetsp:Transcript_12835/g.32005  ORF Transcript_12835/g.32005 Transcript_12835/m.32005 type:complete len:746 (+) Transcript_12835:62-2299(+)
MPSFSVFGTRSRSGYTQQTAARPAQPAPAPAAPVQQGYGGIGGGPVGAPPPPAGPVTVASAQDLELPAPAPGQSGITVEVANGEVFSGFRVQPPESGRRPAVDVVCCVDSSGSMGSLAQAAGVENSGLSVMDLTKHAVKTVIHTLSDCDRLAVVQYNSEAQVVQPLQAMTAGNKSTTEARLKDVLPSGRTNIWDGLLKSLNQLESGAAEEIGQAPRVKVVLLLTDGQPNMSPLQGEAEALREYMETHPQLMFTVSTFGFGYNLDSKLLLDLAEVGSGHYAFIPDSGMVGTVFVHAIANALCVCSHNATVTVKPFPGTVLGPPVGNWPVTKYGSCYRMKIGCLSFGRTKDFLFPVEAGSGQLHVSVEFKNPRQEGGAGAEASECIHAAQSSSPRWLEAQLCRLKMVEALQLAFQRAGLPVSGYSSSTQQQLDAAKSEMQALRTFVGASPARGERNVVEMMKDVDGQVQEAFSKTEWYNKWGVHFLPSLCRAHQLQECNNFKDFGVQVYTSAMFEDARDLADDKFNTLPAPEPSQPVYSYGGISAAPAAPAPVVNMAAFNNAMGPCFHGECLVRTADGHKQVQHLERGDVVISGDHRGVVSCVVATICPQGAPLVTLGKLLITPYHPVFVDSEWRFPVDIAPVTSSTTAIFSVVLDGSAILEIEGVQCASLGHGVSGPVIGHEYWGTQKVVDDLKQMAGWDNGRIILAAGCVVRNSEGEARGLVGQPARWCSRLPPGPAGPLGFVPL